MNCHDDRGGEGDFTSTSGSRVIHFSALLIFSILLTLSVYRKWKIEQEIEGLLWKINPDCLQVNKKG